MAANLAISLRMQGECAGATEIQREVLISTTGLLGAEHETTLIAATNLAHSLSQCSQGREDRQLLRATLAVSRRALGPAHDQTQCVVHQLHQLDISTWWAVGAGLYDRVLDREAHITHRQPSRPMLCLGDNPRGHAAPPRLAPFTALPSEGIDF